MRRGPGNRPVGSYEKTEPQQDALWQPLTSRGKVLVQISRLAFGMLFPMGTMRYTQAKFFGQWMETDLRHASVQPTDYSLLFPRSGFSKTAVLGLESFLGAGAA